MEIYPRTQSPLFDGCSNNSNENTLGELFKMADSKLLLEVKNDVKFKKIEGSLRLLKTKLVWIQKGVETPKFECHYADIKGNYQSFLLLICIFWPKYGLNKIRISLLWWSVDICMYTVPPLRNYCTRNSNPEFICEHWENNK